MSARKRERRGATSRTGGETRGLRALPAHPGRSPLMRAGARRGIAIRCGDRDADPSDRPGARAGLRDIAGSNTRPSLEHCARSRRAAIPAPAAPPCFPPMKWGRTPSTRRAAACASAGGNGRCASPRGSSRAGRVRSPAGRGSPPAVRRDGLSRAPGKVYLWEERGGRRVPRSIRAIPAGGSAQRPLASSGGAILRRSPAALAIASGRVYSRQRRGLDGRAQCRSSTRTCVVVGAGGTGLRPAIAIAEADPYLSIALLSKVYPRLRQPHLRRGGRRRRRGEAERQPGVSLQRHGLRRRLAHRPGRRRAVRERDHQRTDPE